MNQIILKLSLFVIALLTVNITSAQTITSFPYTEDFESFTTCGTGCGAICNLTGGTNTWKNSKSDDLDWSVDISGTTSSNTGPTRDHNSSNTAGKYLYVESSCSGIGFPNMTASIESPAIDLKGTNDIQFEFWYHMYGISMGTMHIDISTDGGTNWTQDIIPSWTDNLDLWQNKTVSLKAYTGQTVIVRIRHVTGGNFYSDAAIDAIHVYDLLKNDAGISGFVDPLIPTCDFTDTVKVALKNHGTDTLKSAIIDWFWNDTAQAQKKWTGLIAPNTIDTIYLGNASYVNGDVLTALTSLPNGVVEIQTGKGNDTTTITLSKGLKGTYSIGTKGDYLNFTAAVTALNTFGVCGPVVFEVEDGIYTEQIILTEVKGMNAINTVTFQSMNMDPSLVTLEFSGTSKNNFVIWMNGADYFHFDNLTIFNKGVTFGTVLLINGNATNNTWTNNIIQGDSNVTSTSTNMALVFSNAGISLDSMNTFESNAFKYGSIGFYYYGNTTTELESGTVITNNSFTDFYYRGLHMYYQKDMKISGNTLNPSTKYTGAIYRIYITYGDGGMRIYNNQVNGTRYGYGIYMSNCDALVDNRGYIYNNFISIGDSTNTNTSYGLYVTASNNQVLTFNSVNMESKGSATRSIYATGGNQNYILNNIFRNSGPGYGMYYISGVVESNNNNIYVPNGKPFYFDADIQDLATWHSVTGFDNASITMDPMFKSFDDLHSCQDLGIDAGALPDTMVLMDIDGQKRDLKTPDIGADEFLGLSKLSFTSDTILKCSNETLTLGGFEPKDDATSYLWNTMDTTATIDVPSGGPYSLKITTVCGTDSLATEVEVIPEAVANFTMFRSYLTAAPKNTSSGTITSYHWDFGDGNTSTDINPVYLYSSTGKFIITLTVTGPCGTDVHTDTMLSAYTGMDDFIEFQSMDVYPNPTKGNVNIHFEEVQQGVQVKVSNALGQVLFNKYMGSTNSAQVTIDGEAGMYFMEITTADGKREVVKVMKE